MPYNSPNYSVFLPYFCRTKYWQNCLKYTKCLIRSNKAWLARSERWFKRQYYREHERSGAVTKPNCCSYEGVCCSISISGDASLYRITRMDLGNLSLSGTLPLSIGFLTSLAGTIPSLSLRDYSLTCTIPSAIGALKLLNILELDYNSLTGTIPSTISALETLSWLFLRENSLRSTISSSVSSIPYLRYLNLSTNSLTGNIPSRMSANLRYVSLGVNSLTGTIPSIFGNFTRMSSLLIETTP